jgi:hypothetical protein
MFLEKTTFTVNDELDFVTLKCGTIDVRIGYRVALSVAKSLMETAAHVARFQRISIKDFKEQMQEADLEDSPRPNRRPRQSKLTPTATSWETYPTASLIGLLFDGEGMELDPEFAWKMGSELRRAGRRAKAWAGDSSKISNCTGILTDAEEDYRLGVA